MPKIKNNQKEYSFLALKLVDYIVRVDGSINYKVRDIKRAQESDKIYAYSTYLELNGICTYPEERVGHSYNIAIYDHETYGDSFSATLSDCRVKDDYGIQKYKKIRGKEVPIYNVPNGIGYIEKVRGELAWHGAAWISPRTVSDMLVLLVNVKPLYINIHEHNENRKHLIVGITLQTSDPAEE